MTAAHDALDDSQRADPVTSRLATLLGTTTARVDLLSGLAFAVVLEGVACLLWTVVLQSSHSTEPAVDVTRMTQPAAAAVTAVTSVHASSTVGSEAVTGSPETPDDPVPPSSVTDAAEDDVSRLLREIDAGRLRATVVDIRRHLGCSQARAIALRRQLASRNMTA